MSSISDKLENLLVSNPIRSSSDDNLQQFIDYFSPSKTQGNNAINCLDPLSLFKVYMKFTPADSQIADKLRQLDGKGGYQIELSEVDSEFEIDKYVQDIEIPKMTIPDGTASENFLIGKYPVNGTYVTPDNNNLVFSMLNTSVPLIENVIYPWMREVTIPRWCYDRQPYTMATITIDHTIHSNVKYVYYGCRPAQLEMLRTTQNQTGENIVRQVTFKYDIMCVLKA